MRRTLCAVVAALLCGSALPAGAQQGFLFERPVFQVTLRGGPTVPRAESDIFDFLTTELTLERDDFRTPSFGFDLAALVGERVDIVVGASWAEARNRSEFRDWIGGDGEPISQNTRLMTMPVGVTLRYHPIRRGRHVADYAWLPARVSPYIGGGAGFTWYRLEQDGEFLDATACRNDPDTGCDIFLNTYESSDVAQTLHAVAGVEYWLLPRVGVSIEARYTRGDAALSHQFRNWERIDLTNFEAGVGLSFRW
ncbi:MAG TPA: hypothetical protein VMN60_05005 [Longimicrobiales bacterium]|nr:hypothetical protein [Longimicrobiales bacterium]